MEPTKIELTAADFRVGQKVWVETGEGGEAEIHSISAKEINAVTVTGHFGKYERDISEIKPILRRLDSMTKEENETMCFKIQQRLIYDYLDSIGVDRPRLINGVAIESLIDAGLAVDAATLERSGK